MPAGPVIPFAISAERRRALRRLVIESLLCSVAIFEILRAFGGFGFWPAVHVTGAVTCGCAALELFKQFVAVRRERIAHDNRMAQIIEDA